MLPYRSEDDSPTKAAVTRRKNQRAMSPLMWWLIGVGLLFALVLFWLLPIGPGTQSFGWMMNLIGVTADARRTPQYNYAASLRGGLILPVALGLLLLAAIASALRTRRRRLALGVLGYLSSAVRLQVPLPPYLTAAADAETGDLSRRLRRTAVLLAQGRSVGLTLHDTAGELPPILIDRIAAAERSFALGESLSDILHRERLALVGRGPSGAGPTYALVVLATIFYVGVAMMIFVIPKFMQIFNDFHLKLPAITLSLIDFFRSLTSSIVAVIVLVLSLLVIASLLSRSLAASTRGLFTSRPRVRWCGDAIDTIAWHAPVVGPLTRHRQTAVVCEALAEALRAGRPLPDAITIATLPSLNVVLRERMIAWRTAVDAGQPTAAAARMARLPGLLCDALAGAAANDGGDTAGAVAFAGRAYAARSDRLAAVVSAVVPVAITFVLGVGVAYVALAMLLPLFKLIDGLTGGPGNYA